MTGFESLTLGDLARVVGGLANERLDRAFHLLDHGRFVNGSSGGRSKRSSRVSGVGSRGDS